MADTQTSIGIKLGYTNTDFTRSYKFDAVSTEALTQCKARAKAINESLAAGTSGGLDDVFIADDFDDSDTSAIVGKLRRITELYSESITETVIF